MLQRFFALLLKLIEHEFQFNIVLIGNKCDLEEEREVDFDDGLTFAAHFQAPFFETSAKVRINIEEAFYTGVREYRCHQVVPPKKPKKSVWQNAIPSKKVHIFREYVPAASMSIAR